jgi:hypothetical protein
MVLQTVVAGLRTPLPSSFVKGGGFKMESAIKSRERLSGLRRWNMAREAIML